MISYIVVFLFGLSVGLLTILIKEHTMNGQGYNDLVKAVQDLKDAAIALKTLIQSLQTAQGDSDADIAARASEIQAVIADVKSVIPQQP